MTQIEKVPDDLYQRYQTLLLECDRLQKVEAKNERLLLGLHKIEGGFFPEACELALSGSWHIMVGELQRIARETIEGAA